jgi:gingipain R
MSRAWVLILLLLLTPGLAFSDSSNLEGGVFIAHHPPGLQFSAGQDYCQRYFQDFAIDSCSEQNNRIDLDGNQGQTSVWYVLAAWGEEKEWCGAEFGFAAFDSTIYGFTQWGPCFPGGANDGLQLATTGWPGPNAGVSLSISSTPWSGNFVPIYWFMGYSYYQGEIPLAVNPGSAFGGTANCETPPQSWDATAFGGMGIFQEGTYACPEGLDGGGGGLDGGMQPDGAGGYGGYEPDGEGQEFGEPEWVGLGGDPGDPLDVHLVESDGSTSVLELTIGGFYRTPVEIEGKTYYQISLAEEPVSADSCQPALPHVPRSLIIPDDQRMVFSIDSSTYEDLGSMAIAPSKGLLPMAVDPDSVPYCLSAAYESDSLYPAEIIKLCRPYILRDFRGMVVDLRPFQAMPASDSLRVYTHLVVEVAPAGVDTSNVLSRHGPVASVDRQFAALYRDHFLNYGLDGSRDLSPTEEDQGLLVLAGSTFPGAVLDSLVDWKLQEGLPTRLRIVAEDSLHNPALIKHIMWDAYDSWHPAHVLLVGDEPQMATFPILYWPPSDIRPADPIYTLFGSDMYPDVLVGRFSAWDSSELATQVERTIAYERDIGPNASWLAQGSGIAYPGGETFMDGIRDSLLSYTYTAVDQIYSPEQWIEEINGDLTQGRGIVNYLGHGAWNSWAFDLRHGRYKITEALENYCMLPFIMSCACDNGYFSYWPQDPDSVCFAEQWMRAVGPAGQPRGAIATLMSSIPQYPAISSVAMRHAASLLKGEQLVTIGGLWYGAELAMLDAFAGDPENRDDAEWTFKTWTLFGDPSLLLRTRAPEGMEVVHAETILLGQESYSVRVSDPQGGPVAAAHCVIRDGWTLCGAALTDAQGLAVIALEPTPEFPRTLTLRVTVRNRPTYVGAIQPVGILVTPDGRAMYPTLQAAVDTARADWTIVLRNGTYQGDGNRDLRCHGKSLTLMSESGNPGSCIIDCDGNEQSPHWGIDVDDAREENSATLVLRSITIREAGGGMGGAVLCRESGVRAYDCVFSDNEASWGGAVLCTRTSAFERCTFLRNTAEYDAGAVQCIVDPGTISIAHCTFVSNSAGGYGGGLAYFGRLELDHCTFYGNAAGASGAGISCGRTDTTTIANTIVASSTDGSAVYYCGDSTFVLTCCDLWDNSDGNWEGQCIADQYGGENISADPIFCAAGSGDFTLHSGSPCLPGHHPNGATCGTIGAWPIGCPGSGIEDDPHAAYVVPRLQVLAPNPFVPPEQIVYEIPGGSGPQQVSLQVFDPAGRVVRTLASGRSGPGRCAVVWDGSDGAGMKVPAGAYFLRLTAGGASRLGRAVILR